MAYQDLGFSLKPPAWLRSIAGAVVRGTTVTVPTPNGPPMTVDLGNPDSIAAAKAALSKAKVSSAVGTRPDAPGADVPVLGAGGSSSLLMLGAVALGALFLMRGKR